MNDWLFEDRDNDLVEALQRVATPFSDLPPLNRSLSEAGIKDFDDDWLMEPIRSDWSKEPGDTPLALYDTAWTDPGDGGGGDPPPLDPTPLDPPPTDPPPPPTTRPFDYSDLLTDPGLTEWLEWLDGYAPSSGGDGDDGYDSLEEFMHGQWHMDIDPELIDFGGSGPGGPGYAPPAGGGQFGTATVFGFTNSAGMLVPVFREWTTLTSVDTDGNPATLEDMEVTHHRQIMGYERVMTFQVASNDLDGIRDQIRQGQTALQVFEVVEMFRNLGTFFSPPQDNDAIRDYVFNEDGTASATVVSQDGRVIGRVVVNEYGFTMYDRNGNVMEADNPLFQEWNTMQGVNLNHDLASQAHRLGVPFAQFLTSVARLPMATVMSGMQLLAFGFMADALSNFAFGDATARARFEEAAYELRRQVLLRRGG